MTNRPDPPPEGVIIKDAAGRAGLSIREAASRTGISSGRWRQIVTGVQHVSPGVTAAVRAPARTIARMAQATGEVEPEELEKADRADAADVLRELRKRAGNGTFTPPAPRPGDAAGVSISLDTVRAIVGETLIDTATAIHRHTEEVLTWRPKATGADIFPDEPDLAELWDLTPSLPVPERSRYAAIMRLGRLNRNGAVA